MTVSNTDPAAVARKLPDKGPTYLEAVIAELRQGAKEPLGGCSGESMAHAATFLEDQRATIDSLSAELSEAKALAEAKGKLWVDFSRKHAAAELRAESAERSRDAALSEVERLRGALEEIAEEHDAGRHDGLPEACPAHDDVTMWRIAGAALSTDQASGGGNG